MNVITVHLRNGGVAQARVDEAERMGWEHLLQTTLAGERLADLDVVTLSHPSGLTEYIVASEVVKVVIQ
jgi:hypothetical protein